MHAVMLHGKHRHISLSRLFFLSLCLLVTVFLCTSFLASSLTYFLRFQSEEEAIRREYTQAQQELLKLQVDNAVSFIEHTISLSEDRLLEMLEERTNEAWEVARHLYESHSETMDRETLQALIIEAIRPMRYSDGRGYYFIVRTDGQEMLFADRPEMEGRNLLDMQGPDGTHVIREMISLAGEQEEGFISYRWTKPGAGGDDHEKLSYVKLFKPYDWIIGTGEYLENMDSDLQGDVLQWLVKVRYGEGGYLFGSYYNGDALFTNGSITRGTGNLWDLTDPEGVKIIQEQIRVVEEAGGGFVNYSWRKLDGEDPTPKLAYVRGVDEWGWIIGTGVYLDDMQAAIGELRARLRSDILRDALRTGLILACGLLLSLVAARLLSSRLDREIHLFDVFFSRAEDGGAEIDSSAMGITEFRNLAEAANRMSREQHTARAALAESEQRFRSFVENAPLPMVVEGVDETLRYMNTTFTDTFGYTMEDFPDLATGFVLCYPDPDYRAEAAKRWQEARNRGLREGGVVRAGEFRFTGKDGTVWILDIRGVIIQDTVLVVFQDMTQAREAEARLESSLRELSRTKTLMDEVFEQSPIPMVVASAPDMVLRVVNPACREILGMTEDMVGQPLLSIRPTWTDYSADGKPMSIEELPLARALAGERTEGVEIRVVRGDGSVRWEEVWGTPVYDAEGELIAGYIVFPDITMRKMTEELMVQSEKMLSLGALAAGMAHEINNPLAAILGSARNIERRTMRNLTGNKKAAESCGVTLDGVRCYLEQREVPGMLNAIQESGERAASIVRSMLSFSRKESKEMSSHSLAELLDRSVELAASDYDLKKEYDFRQIRITRDYAPDVEPVSCLGGEMQQVFLNLFKNAAQAMAERPEVPSELRLGVYREGDHAVVRITDNGPGMEEKTRKHLFEPFYTTKSPGAGTGLGLSVSYFIVTKFHKGSIEVESAPGQGASFIIRLPFRG